MIFHTGYICVSSFCHESASSLQEMCLGQKMFPFQVFSTYLFFKVRIYLFSISVSSLSLLQCEFLDGVIEYFNTLDFVNHLYTAQSNQQPYEQKQPYETKLLRKRFLTTSFSVAFAS